MILRNLTYSAAVQVLAGTTDVARNHGIIPVRENEDFHTTPVLN
jgi:hypothetical protein